MPRTSLRPPHSPKVQRVAVAALFATLALAGCGRRGGSPAGQQAGTPVAAADQKVTSAMTVTTTTIRNESITRTVEATGSIQPWQEVIIGPEVGGYRVAAVLVDVGDHVKRGQTLVRLSAELLDAEVASRRAALRSAEARAANADAALRRGQAVQATGALSKANLDQLAADQITARAQVETARSDLATSDLRLKYTQVTASDDGIITSRTVSVGQVAQTGAELLRMLRQGRVEWRAEVPESRLALLKAGQAVSITSSDGSHIEGKVRMVAPTVSVNNRTALVYVDIAGGSARPGQFASGSISVGEGDALLAPVTSVVLQDGYSYVFVLKQGDVVERRLVQTADVHGDGIVIVSGLKPGEVVAVKGAGFLKDRDTVKVVNEPAATSPAALVSKTTP
jgi:HlyD family secretion protein